jgi:hypothetical protein
MNYLQKNRETNRLIGFIRQSNRCGSHEGCVRIFSNNTDNHEVAKLIVAKKLKSLGWSVWTEAIFNNGARADIMAVKDGNGVIVEILETEVDKIKKLKENPKKSYYPEDFEFIELRSEEAKDFSI